MLSNIGNIWQKWSLNIVKISAQKNNEYLLVIYY